jgi:hypothetical protein
MVIKLIQLVFDFSFLILIDLNKIFNQYRWLYYNRILWKKDVTL